jgi:hypothetical protein
VPEENFVLPEGKRNELLETQRVFLETKRASGNETSFSGNATSFSGNATSFSGNAMSFSGNAMSFSGNATSFSGNVASFSGNATNFLETQQASETQRVSGNGASFWKPFCSKYQKHSSTELRQIPLSDHCPQVFSTHALLTLTQRTHTSTDPFK